MKERKGIGLRRDLRVIAPAFEGGAGFQRQARRFSRAFHLTGEYRSDERLGCRVGGVVDDEAARPEDGLDPPPECLAHPRPCPVGLPDGAEELRRECRRLKGGFELGDRAGDRFVELNACDRTLMGPRRVTGAQRPDRQVGVEHLARLHFVPVMVLGINPEDGDRRHAMLVPHTIGQTQCGQRLEQGEERSAEKSGLLPGDDGDRLRIAQLRGGGDGIRRSAATALLRLKDVGNGVAIPWMALGPCDCVAPRGGVGGIAGKKLGDAGVIERVIGRQSPNPRKPADVDGKPCA
jgi:hypothetical protein